MLRVIRAVAYNALVVSIYGFLCVMADVVLLTDPAKCCLTIITSGTNSAGGAETYIYSCAVPKSTEGSECHDPRAQSRPEHSPCILTGINMNVHFDPGQSCKTRGQLVGYAQGKACVGLTTELADAPCPMTVA